MVQFDRVCSMLGKGRNERGQVLEQLVGSAVLVQGCWVVQSALVIPKEKARLRLARDYVVCPLMGVVYFEKNNVCSFEAFSVAYIVAVVLHSKSLIDQEGSVGHFKGLCACVVWFVHCAVCVTVCAMFTLHS